MLGKHAEAISHARLAHNLQPANPEVRYVNGLVYRRAGN
jgi:Flp pilus assembly protein TadD